MIDTKRKIAVMQAYLEGKTIEIFVDNDWVTEPDPMWAWGTYEYRIKSEPKLRPYKNAEEVLKAYKEHGPFIKCRTSNKYYSILAIAEDGVKTSSNGWYLNDILDNHYTWQDGTPCGMIE